MNLRCAQSGLDGVRLFRLNRHTKQFQLSSLRICTCGVYKRVHIHRARVCTRDLAESGPKQPKKCFVWADGPCCTASMHTDQPLAHLLGELFVLAELSFFQFRQLLLELQYGHILAVERQCQGQIRFRTFPLLVRNLAATQDQLTPVSRNNRQTHNCNCNAPGTVRVDRLL